VSQLELVLDEIVIERPDDVEQHLCADKGYTGEPALQAMKDRHYLPHVKQRGEEIQEKKANPAYKARRWVVEVASLLIQSVQKTLGEVRETHRDLRGPATHGGCYYALQESGHYLWIRSKNSTYD